MKTWQLVVAIAGIILFTAIMAPIAHRDNLRRDKQFADDKAEVVQILKNHGPMTASDVRDHMTQKHGIKYVRGVLGSLTRDKQVGSYRLRHDDSPARWYDGTFDTKTMYKVN